MKPLHEESSASSLRARYDALWDEALPKIESGAITLDAHALQKDRDRRRGITLLARPDASLSDSIEKTLAQLRAVEPAQYYQPRSDLHLTVLSLFTATAQFEPFLADRDRYREAVAEAVEGVPPIEVAFRGLTVTSSAILARGFPSDTTLEDLRGRLRSALAARGLAGALDQRYRLATAHMTLVRFAAPLGNPRQLVRLLERLRDAEIGTTRITQLELVLGDWYQSRENEQHIAAYALTGPRRA